MRRTGFGHLALAGFLLVGVAAGDAHGQQYTLVSVSTGGGAGNNGSFGAVFSGDAKVVAFSSNASDLITGDTNNNQDVFVRDLAAPTTTRVSIASDGSERAAPSGFGSVVGAHMGLGTQISLNSNGSQVAFASWGAFDAADTNGFSDVYVRDRTLNQTTRLSAPPGGGSADGSSGDPRISADGRYVVFTSVASNLIAGDANNVEDVFLRDRTTNTTTRVSLSSTGGELSAASYGGRVSADGSIIAFLSDANVAGTPDANCPPAGACTRAFVLDRGTGQIIRVPVPAVPSDKGTRVIDLDLSPDGRFVAMLASGLIATRIITSDVTNLDTYDRLTGRVEVDGVDYSAHADIAINGSGRLVSMGGSRPSRAPQAIDRSTLSSTTVPTDEPMGALPAPRFTPDGLQLLFDSTTSHVAEDPDNFGQDVYILQLDTDHDGMPDAWETSFGLNPNDPSDAALDSDGDGSTNLQEFQNSTNPKGTFKRYFAEGAANSFFTTRFGLFNPGDQPAHVAFEYLGSNGMTRTSRYFLTPHQQMVILLNARVYTQPDEAFSTVVESDQPVVIDRTMSWDQNLYGSHAETAIEAPATTWYLAEGSTGGAFDLFYLLENPGDATAVATVNYLRPAPAPPIVKTYTVGAKSRRTIYVDTEDPLLAATDLSAKITSDQPILAERAMYFSTPTQPFAAGHEGAAVTAPATSWFFAEGATGAFFDEFLLLANAETTDANVQITYLLPIGAPIVKTYTVSAQSRLTVNVDFEDPALKDTPVSAIVESKNGVPIVAERAMWWPSPNWYEAHLSAGATTTGTRWALADGWISSSPYDGAETYILIANTSNTPGTADVTLYYQGVGDVKSITKTFTLPANSRVNVQVSVEFPELEPTPLSSFGAIIQSSGPPIVVERAMYQNVGGQIWGAGTDALATKLQ